MASRTGDCDKMLSSTSTQPCRRFSLAEIMSATKNFDEELLIGQGGFGKVYRGQVGSEETDLFVAIKRLDSMSNQGSPEFKAEIKMLSKLRHSHLVSLIGFCDDDKEMILVYEYMQHGSLHHHLHKAETPLSWVRRMKIAIGAARGLDYLHTGVGTKHGIIHRDVKSSNILLDENWEAMISDFGLSKIGPTNESMSYVDASVKGTFGYLDPEFFYTRKLTIKTDVYAFGVVLFELLSGKLAVDVSIGEEQCSLVRWAQKCVKEQKIDQLVDSKIRGTISPKCLIQMARIADHCLLSVPKERPTMTKVVASLEALLELQQKYDNSAQSSGIMGFPWKIHKYLVSATKQNSTTTTTTNPIPPGQGMGEVERRQILPLPQDKPGSRETASKETSGKCMCARETKQNFGDLKVFTYGELKHAARNFRTDRRMGKGSYGEIYKGWVAKTTSSASNDDTGLPIAIKRLHGYRSESPEKLLTDLEKLKEFNHPNFIKLIGYCFNGKTLFLIYEFMQNGNFEDLLCSGVAQLPLVTKVKIAIGIARGLVFLNETQHEVSESLLDRHKILLDKDFTVKLSGYDVTKLIDGHYTSVDDENDESYHPGYQPYTLQSNLSGFIVVFAELLSERNISNDYELRMANYFLFKSGTYNLSLAAELCFEICNEADAEFKLLTILNKYIQAEADLPRCRQWHSDKRRQIHRDLHSRSVVPDRSTRSLPEHHGDLKVFTYGELKHAARNFRTDRRMGKGSYGEIYKGWVAKMTPSASNDDTGLPIAIKRLHGYRSESPEKLLTDLEKLKEFNHPNFIKLIGYCFNGKTLFLIYEFMQNGNFEDLLCSGGVAQLPLVTKVKIAIGIARGLVFLNETQHEDFTVKLSGYDVTKLIDGHYTSVDDENDESYHPGYQPYTLQSNFSGFIVVFAELLSERNISNDYELRMANLFLFKSGTYNLSLAAELCLEICNEANAEFKLLTILNKYIQAGADLRRRRKRHSDKRRQIPRDLHSRSVVPDCSTRSLPERHGIQFRSRN